MINPTDQTKLSDIVSSIKLMLLDVDGVLTDGGLILIGNDQEAKRFDVQDGMGITIARAAGIKVGIVTARVSDVVERRANELKLDMVFQGSSRKSDVLDILKEKENVMPSEIAFIGDDIQDMSIMKLVGLPIAVQNAVDAVKQCSSYVTDAYGGHGAIREAIDWILDLRGDKSSAYNKIIG